MTAVEQPVLVITGMHRSGTSLAASVFQSAGLSIGKRLMGPAPSNIPGHFEDLDFVELHERILVSSGLCHTGLAVPSEQPPVPDALRDAAVALIADRMSAGLPWGWKDPRTVLFLDFWHSLLPRTCWVFMCRSPWGVVDSLFRRGDPVFRDNPALAVEIWRHFNTRILDFVNRYPDRAMVVDISQLAADAAGVVARAAATFGIGLAQPTPIFRGELLSTRTTDTHVASIRAACPDAYGLHDHLRRLAGLPASGAAGAGTDPATAALVEWVRSTEVDRKATALDRDLQATLRQAASLEAALDSGRNELEAVRRDFQEASAAAELLREQLCQEQREAAAALDAVRQELAARDGALQSLEKTAAERAAQVERLLNERKAMLDQAETRRLELMREAGRLRNTVAEQEAEAERQAREVVELRARLAVLEDERSGLAAALQAARSHATTLEEEIHRRSEEVGRAEAACRTEAERCRQLMASKSMRLTGPLREARRWLSDPRGRAGRCGRSILRFARRVYESLPFGPRTRLRLRRFLAARIPWVLLASGSPAETISGLAPASQPLVLVPSLRPAQATGGRQGADAWEPIRLPQYDRPLVSIIVPVHNQWAFTHACLRSILAAEPALAYEIILADDASTDDTVAASHFVRGLVIQRNTEPLGFLGNCNRAARLAQGDHLLFLNNDTQVQPGAISALLEVFRTHPDAGLVGAKLVYPDGRLQEAGGILWADGSAWNYGRGQDPTLAEFNYLRETDYCSGAAILVSRSLFEQLGGFDDRFAPAYCEDSDLAFSIRAAGRKVYYQPEAVVVHHEGASHGTDTSQGQKAYQVVNQRQFHEKWRETLEREHFPNGQNVFQARDRSAGKPCILVIDHYIPQPDRDAGSRTMWCFLRLFRQQGMSVKFWPHNLHDDRPYARRLEAAGIEIMYGPRFVNRFPDWVREYGKQIDYVLLSRPHVAAEFLKPLRRHSGARLLYYGHDLHHARLERESELKGDPGLAKQAGVAKKLEQSVWRQVDAVYYPSADETAVVAACCDTPTRTVPAYYFDDLSIEPPPAAGREGICFVAGFAHPPNVDAAEWLVSEIMPLVWQAAPATKLWIVGSNPSPAVQALAGDRVEVTGYVTDERLAEIYRTGRVAVVPLRFGAGVKNKVIEALHHGLPLVTTPVGAQGLAGIESIVPVAADPATLARHILEFLQHDQRWEVAAAAGRRFVAERFSAATMWEVFAADMMLPEEVAVGPIS